ncbi:MAG: aminotransferase class V-fold PLP-dependent enzyme [Actinomycetota bacterium]|nr:aminotransferase class V-fold PLP-dependent enzyme [Actinomycetota bacterium]
MFPYLRAELGNPSSDHALRRRVRQAVEEARATLAALVGAAPSEVVFTTGSACHTGDHTPNATLLAMGVPPRSPSARCGSPSVAPPPGSKSKRPWSSSPAPMRPLSPPRRHRPVPAQPKERPDEGPRRLERPALWHRTLLQRAAPRRRAR